MRREEIRRSTGSSAGSRLKSDCPARSKRTRCRLLCEMQHRRRWWDSENILIISGLIDPGSSRLQKYSLDLGLSTENRAGAIDSSPSLHQGSRLLHHSLNQDSRLLQPLGSNRMPAAGPLTAQCIRSLESCNFYTGSPRNTYEEATPIQSEVSEKISHVGCHVQCTGLQQIRDILCSHQYR